jgi:hypothetical protein
VLERSTRPQLHLLLLQLMLMLQRNGKGDEFDSRSSKNDRPRMMASNDGAAGREISDKHSEHR